DPGRPVAIFEHQIAYDAHVAIRDRQPLPDDRIVVACRVANQHHARNVWHVGPRVLVAIGIARTRGSAIRKILTAGYRRQVERVEKTRLVVGSGEAPLIVDCVTYVET